MKTISSAGNTPTRNIARHPNLGKMVAATTAASMYPMAHPDCINETARAR